MPARMLAITSGSANRSIRTGGLLAHLEFEGYMSDSSGRGNGGKA